MSWTWRGTGFLCHRDDPKAKEAREALQRNKKRFGLNQDPRAKVASDALSRNDPKAKLRRNVTIILHDPKNQHWVSDSIADENDRQLYIYQKVIEVLKDKYGYTGSIMTYSDFLNMLNDMAMAVGKPTGAGTYNKGFKRI